MNEVYDFLKKCGTFFLATEEDGQPPYSERHLNG